MKRICLLAFAISSIVALAQVAAQAQVTSPTPSQTQKNCDECKMISENCQHQKTDVDKAYCQKMASQCRCSR